MKLAGQWLSLKTLLSVSVAKGQCDSVLSHSGGSREGKCTKRNTCTGWKEQTSENKISPVLSFFLVCNHSSLRSLSVTILISATNCESRIYFRLG